MIKPIKVNEVYVLVITTTHETVHPVMAYLNKDIAEEHAKKVTEYLKHRDSEEEAPEPLELSNGFVIDWENFSPIVYKDGLTATINTVPFRDGRSNVIEVILLCLETEHEGMLIVEAHNRMGTANQRMYVLNHILKHRKNMRDDMPPTEYEINNNFVFDWTTTFLQDSSIAIDLIAIPVFYES